MPLAQTVNGLVDEISCDDVTSGWATWQNIGSCYWMNDESVKKEGVASQKSYGACPAPSYPGDSWSAKPFVGMNPGNRLRIWHKATDTKHYWTLIMFGDNPYSTPPNWVTLIGAVGQEDWTRRDIEVPDKLWGQNYTQSLRSRCGFTGQYGDPFENWIDHIVIAKSNTLTITGLVPGQKVAMYRTSDNVKIHEGTCAGGQTQITFDMSGDEYPLYVYCKVYATDGVTLIETTANYKVSGGDTWYWTPPYGSLTLASTAFIIIRQAGSGSPKSATITATLKKPNGDPATGKTLYFSTSRGTVNPTSAVTDSGGHASTTLTSDTHGIAIVKCDWPGDSVVPAAVAYANHHVFYTTEVADASKNFQLFIEGVALTFTDGSYALSTETSPQQFRIELPDWDANIVPRGLVSIYRLGFKEFSGVLTRIQRDMSETPHVLLQGVDIKTVLGTRVITLKDYSSKTLAYIISDLLATYPCGLTAGTISDYPSTLTVTFADETLVSSISRLCKLTGWVYRVNADYTLDMKDSFGENKWGITFTQGQNLFMSSITSDYTRICNHVRMRGKDTLVSVKYHAPTMEQLGILEEVAFQKSITAQATLDLQAEAELTRKVGVSTAIKADILDEYAADSWGVDDYVQISADEIELSGPYKVVKVTRMLSNPKFASIDATNKVTVELADYLEDLLRQVKDLNVG
jgi:hypothetical protein